MATIQETRIPMTVSRTLGPDCSIRSHLSRREPPCSSHAPRLQAGAGPHSRPSGPGSPRMRSRNLKAPLSLGQVWAPARLGPNIMEKLVRVVAKRASGSKRFVAIIPQRLVENDHVGRESRRRLASLVSNDSLLSQYMEAQHEGRGETWESISGPGNDRRRSA